MNNWTFTSWWQKQAPMQYLSCHQLKIFPKFRQTRLPFNCILGLNPPLILTPRSQLTDQDIHRAAAGDRLALSPPHSPLLLSLVPPTAGVTQPDLVPNNTFYAPSHFYIFYKLTGDDLVLNMSFYDAATHKNYENLPSHWAAKHKMWGESKWFHDENLFKRKLWPGLEVVHTDVEAQAEA